MGSTSCQQRSWGSSPALAEPRWGATAGIPVIVALGTRRPRPGWSTHLRRYVSAMSQPPDSFRGMVCVVCGWWRGGGVAPRETSKVPGHGGMCRPCTGSLHRAAELRLGSGVLVRPLFVHEGPIRSAVHALKYRGADRVAEVLAPFLAGLLPADASALVPVPRALARRIRYGIDPGRVLAREIAQVAGLPVADVLRAPVHRRSQLRQRTAEGLRFRSAGRAPLHAVLVDDVLTTGATMNAAALACRGTVLRAVTLTRSPAPPPAGGR